MIALRSTPTQPQEFDKIERLFRHHRRPDWGIGVWMREERTRRRVCFEDGKVRVFKRGYYHLLRPVGADEVDVSQTFDAIVAERDAMRIEQRRQAAALKRKPLMSFDDQLSIFARLYEDGFADAAYLDAHRAPAAGNRPLKRHIDAVLTLASEQLAQATLAKEVEGDPSAVVATCVALLERCRFVERKEVAPLRELAVAEHKAYAEGLYDALYGSGTPPARMGRWLELQADLLGKELSWSFATAMLPLVQPRQHICVKQKLLEFQARSVAPEVTVSVVVSELAYRKALRVTKATHEALKKAGLKPRDLFDVRVFTWETLRPKAKALLS